MNYVFALLGAVIIGACAAIEPTVNSGLGKIITPRLATLHSFLVGTVLVVIINFFAGGFKEYRNILNAPPYLWIGGLLGFTVVFLGSVVLPVIGAASTITLMVASQMAVGIIIDSLGLFGIEKVPLDLGRIVGLILIVVAVRLIVK